MINFSLTKCVNKSVIAAVLSLNLSLEASIPSIDSFIPFKAIKFTALPRVCYTAKEEAIEQKIEYDFNIIFSAMNYLYEYQGTVSNPNFLVDEGATANALANFTLIEIAINDLILQFQNLGVSDASITTIDDALYAFVEYAISYCLDLNLQNTGQPSGSPIIDANSLLNAGIETGTAFFNLTGNLEYITIWSSLAILITQNVQAYRGVLTNYEILDSEISPSDPSLEAFSAAILSQQLTSAAMYFGGLFVFDWVEKGCSVTQPSSSGHLHTKKIQQSGGWEKYRSKNERFEPLRKEIIKFSKKIRDQKAS